MTRWARPGFALAAAIAAACAGGVAAPRDQWLITVSTDASVPEIGDRLLVEIVDTDGTPCDGCTRTFGLTSTSFPLSFGIEPTGGSPALVYATLFRGEQSGADGRPIDAAHLEGLGLLPAASGVTPVSLELPMACFGIASDPVGQTTCDPGSRTAVPATLLGVTTPLVQGSWAPGQTVDCTSSPPTGAVCVPGGAFLMGSHQTVQVFPDQLSFPEHLVQLDPYFLDVDEVSIQEIRALLSAGTIAPTFAPMIRTSDPTTNQGACTYLGLSDATNDALPASCVTYAAAAAICKARGGQLPTEAQWEYAARNTSTESTYPWGEDPDICASAAVSLGRNNSTSASNVFEYGACRSLPDGGELPWGPVPVGTSPNDVTQLGIHDLGGNLTEWVLDGYQQYDEACWTGGAPQLVNPSCATASTTHQGDRPLRGGSWADIAYYANAATRDAALETIWLPGIGFRCAFSM